MPDLPLMVLRGIAVGLALFISGTCFGVAVVIDRHYKKKEKNNGLKRG